MIDEWKKGAKYWDKAWNPVIGCRPISDGCVHCYAARLADQYSELRDANGGFTPHPPKQAKNPPRNGVIFAGNMTDLLGFWNDVGEIHKWLSHLSPSATNLVLTKRANRISDIPEIDLMMDHVYYGITAENQYYFDERAPLLMDSWANRKWISLEPLLGEICIEPFLIPDGKYHDTIDWVVVGAESGPNRRPCNLEWVRRIVADCLAWDCPVFVKQLDIDGKLVKDINQFPADLQIRQIPWK